jgi:serine/threonine-protein kinase
MRCSNCSTNVADTIVFCPECGMRLQSDQVAASGPQRVLLDRYVITQKLGQGGMGAVYRASDRRLSTVNWAVKELSDAALTSDAERAQARDLFRHEAELLAGLSHPNLPRVTDHFDQDGHNYLVMEFVPGETVLAYVSRTGLPQPTDRVLGWARQLCDVLGYLHSQNPPVIFRDLKPANIMITPSGQLKLIDFGIARLFKPGQMKDTQAFGTVGYSAPEQYGRGQTDARSDVYSLGVLLYQLLTGYDPTATPFRLPPANQVNHALSPQTSAALARATANDPADRFTSVEELFAALSGANQSALPPPPVVAVGPVSAPYPPAVLGPVPTTTNAAIASLWCGGGGLALTVASLVFSMLARLSELGTKSVWYNFYMVLGLLGLAVLFITLLLSIGALVSRQTAQTRLGRRHAAIGLLLGSLSLVSCCLALSAGPVNPSQPRPPTGSTIHPGLASHTGV